MFSRFLRIVMAIGFISLLVSPLYGQETQKTAGTKIRKEMIPQPFVGKVFQLKYRDPRALHSVLAPLGSGAGRAMIMSNREFKTLTVRDFPENVAMIENAIKRLDVPRKETPPLPDVELQIHVLIASKVIATGPRLPVGLQDAVAQLRNTLNYKSYFLMTTIVHRARLNSEDIGGEGIATIESPLFEDSNEISYEFHIDGIYPEMDGAGKEKPARIRLSNFGFQMRGVTAEANQTLGSASLSTHLSIEVGEQVVVGTASLRDKAMILIVSVKLVG